MFCNKNLIISLLFVLPAYCFAWKTDVRLDLREKAFNFSENTFLKQGNLSNELRPHPIFHRYRDKQKKTKKYIAAALAFPFPFGIVGLHRIYLGCAPYVPVAYIASVGGGFGILPFIDFCAILSHKKTDTFVNNKKVFMWVE